MRTACACLLDRVLALVELQDAVVQALHAHLHFGHAQPA